MRHLSERVPKLMVEIRGVAGVPVVVFVVLAIAQCASLACLKYFYRLFFLSAHFAKVSKRVYRLFPSIPSPASMLLILNGFASIGLDLSMIVMQVHRMDTKLLALDASAMPRDCGWLEQE